MSNHVHKHLHTNLPRTICKVCGCILVKSVQGNWETVTEIKITNGKGDGD